MERFLFWLINKDELLFYELQSTPNKDFVTINVKSYYWTKNSLVCIPTIILESRGILKTALFLYVYLII